LPEYRQPGWRHSKGKRPEEVDSGGPLAEKRLVVCNSKTGTSGVGGISGADGGSGLSGENTRVYLVKRPIGEATPDCFALSTEILSDLESDQVRVEVHYISVDAGTRTMLRGEGFHQQVGLGETILAGGVGRIVESKVEGWEVGQAVRGGLGAQTLATCQVEHLERIDESVAPLSAYL
jgi:hypothetical protein